MQRQEQLLRVAVLGQIQGGGPESAAAFGDLLYAEGFARSRRAEYRHRQGLHSASVLQHVTLGDIIVKQGPDGVIILDLVLVDSGHLVVPAEGHPGEQFLRPLVDDPLRHRQVSARLLFAVLIQDHEGGNIFQKCRKASLRNGDSLHASFLLPLQKAHVHRPEGSILRKGQKLARIRREQKVKTSPLSYESAFLVQKYHHIGVGPESPQRVVDRQLQQELVDGPLIGNPPCNRKIQLPQMLHLKKGNSVFPECILNLLPRDIFLIHVLIQCHSLSCPLCISNL